MVEERPVVPSPEEEPPDLTRPMVTACDDFEPSPVYTYAAKVKNLISGLPLTSAELTQLIEEPDRLGDFIDAWMLAPEADAKLLEFFVTAFQQEGFEEGGLTEQWAEPDIRVGSLLDEDTSIEEPFRENFETSFARTALEIVRNGRPFNEVVTTRDFMMTTAMMTTIAFQDDRHRRDDGNAYYHRMDEIITDLEYQSRERFPESEVLDPMSEHFMRFFIDDERIVPPCADGVVSYESAANAPRAAFRALFGYFPRFRYTGCVGIPVQRGPSMLSRADFEDWRVVTIRKPLEGEETARFYELESHRHATEMLLHVPRVGFFTTPAFFAVWATNEDNQSRVTANQTLITAFGESIDDSQRIAPSRDDALDGVHADPTSVCWGCHRTLDPMRQVFRQEYTYFSSEQLDEDVRAVPSSFSWNGVVAEPSSIFEFAEIIATHPDFARGWVQKMCFYANSRACPDARLDDRELIDEIVREFARGYDFRKMVRSLFSSPLVTNAECIEAGTGDNAGISRARHFCAALSHRLSIDDICGMRMFYEDQEIPVREQNAILISTIPNDTFSRGDQDPLTVSDANLFTRGTYERICSNIAQQVVRGDGRFTAEDSASAIDFFVDEIMSLPAPDPRHEGARAILLSHFDEARAVEGGDPTTALQSTFVLACLSPTLIGMGL